MINIQRKADCCGCNACGDACVHKAISFKTDDEGFSYPEIDTNKCVDCHLCEKVCPIINAEGLKKNDYEKSICYAAQSKNLESLFNSTSGSAFVAMAEKVYKQGGYVGGAIFNDDYSASMFLSSDKKDLGKIRNSKYIQASSEGFYIAIKEALKDEKPVLICGLPCQTAAVRSYLKKDYDNLILVDLICLGVNTPRLLKGYLDYMEEKHNSKIVYYKAKNKELGWRQLTTKIVFENGDVEYDKKDTNYFTHAFIGTHAFSRPSCYECKFRGTPRISDITIGDLWGAEKVVGKEYDGDIGTSVVMINSNKGLQFYDSMKSAFKDCEVKYSEATKGNPALFRSVPMPNVDRQKFFEDFNSMKFVDFAKKYVQLPIDKPLGAKKTIRNLVTFIYLVVKSSGLSIRTLFQNLHYNLFSCKFTTNILKGKYIIFNKYCALDIRKGATVQIGGKVLLGNKRVRGSKLETRLLVEGGAKLVMNGGAIAYGADIEVFRNSQLLIGSGIAFNINATIICGDKIEIADDVCFGRNVTVRDNNGGHAMSRRMYKDKRPVVIGQHSWICEHSMVMPGAKVGVGVVVSANSSVYGKLPNFVLVKGNPATIVDEDIYWKA